MITCFFYNKIMPKRPLQLLWAFFCPQFLHQFSGIPGSFRTIKRPQFHGTIIGSCRHGWWTRCDETSKVDHFILRRRLDLLYIYTAILGTGGFPWICRGSWRFTQVFWLEGGFSVLRNQTSIGNIMETTLFHDLPGELEVHTSCNWRETPTKHSETTMNHVRVRVCSPFQSYSIFRKQASVREDGLKKLGYPTTNGETLHFDHEKYPWICSDVISQKNKSHLENSEGRERSPEWNCTSFPSEGTLQVRFSTLTTKSRQNTWLILMARNSYRKNSTSHPKPLETEFAMCCERLRRFAPSAKRHPKRQVAQVSILETHLRKVAVPNTPAPNPLDFGERKGLTLTIPKTSDCKNALDEILKNCFFEKNKTTTVFIGGIPGPLTVGKWRFSGVPS